MPLTPRPVPALLLAALLAIACGGGETARDDATPRADASPVRGGQLVIGSSTDLAGVNELVAPSSAINAEIIRRMFLPLVDEQPDLKTIRPRLAASWEFSDDRRSLTFHLRDDVTWSDGTPVTAADVEFSYRAWTDPDVAWAGAYTVEEVEGVEVVDEHTVRFDFTGPYSTQLLDVAANAVILPEHAWGNLPFSEWRGNSDWFVDHLVVNGPFRLGSWSPQEEVVLERNPLYHEEGLPYLDRVVIKVVPDQSNQITQLLAGQLDFVIQLSPDDVERVEAAPDARALAFWSRSYVAVAWNTDREPFDDVDVRRALTLGIDRPTLVASIWGPYARVISSPVPPGIWVSNPAVEPLAYDPGEARRLLTAAGWVDGDGDGVREQGDRRLAFDLMTNNGNQQREDALVLIQEQLGRIGVEATPQALEFHTMVERAYGGEFDAFVSGWTLPTTFDFRYAFHSDEIATGSNVTGYSNPEVDDLLDRIRAAATLEEAKPMLDRLQVLLQAEQPYTFLWNSQRLVGLRERVHGADPNHLQTLNDLREWWVTP